MKRKLMIGLAVSVIVGVIVFVSVIAGRPRVVAVYPSVIENPDEEVIEMNLKLPDKLDAGDEEYVGYSKEQMMQQTYWCQVDMQSRYEYIIEERLGMDRIEYEFDMDVPYESGKVYIYETDRYYLVDIEGV